MLPNSSINIKSGVSLQIDNSIIHGCTQLWNTINLESEAKLTLNQCTIEDALFGITANENPNLLIKNSHFHKNYIGIYYPEPEPWELLNCNKTFLFSGNEFDCENASLLYPLTGQKSYAGVCIYSLASADLYGDNKNTFHHMRNGIVATNTNLTLHNAKFYNITDNLPALGIGVKLESYATPFFLLAKESQGNLDTTFYNCDNGFYSKNMNNYIAFNKMVDVNFGISVEQSTYCNQTIQSNVIECRNWGITLFENDPVNNVDISNNFIRINNPNSLTTTSRGITLMEFNNPPLEKCEIHNNLIFMDSASIGIYALVANSTNIYNNVISMTKQNINNAGINTTYCLNNITHCNYIQGSYYGYVDTTAIKQNGIQVISSLDSKYSCNQMSNSVVGLKVQNSCLGDSIEGNEFYEHYVGLHYTNTAVTGEQRHKGNKWFGSFQNGYGAKHDGTPALIALSQYMVKPTPSYYVPPSIYGQSWFLFTQTENTYTCTTCELIDTTYSQLSNIDYNITNGLYLNTEFDEEINWISSRYLFNKLSLNNNLLSLDTVFQNYYDSVEYHSVGLFQGTEIDSKSALKPPINQSSELSSLLGSISNIMDSIYKIDSLLATNVPPIDSISLLLSKSNNSSLLKDLHEQYSMLNTGIRSIKEDNIGGVLVSNSMLPENAQYEENEKIINGIYLNTVAIGITQFSPEQEYQITQIAFQCPLSGGNSVYKARVLYQRINDTVFNDDSICEGIAAKRRELMTSKRNNLPLQFTIIPNPASHSVVLQWTEPREGMAILELFDQVGKRIISKQIDLSMLNFQLNTESIDPGIYEICLIDSKFARTCKKLVIIK